MSNGEFEKIESYDFVMCEQLINKGLFVNISVLSDMVKHFPEQWQNFSHAKTFLASIVTSPYFDHKCVAKIVVDGNTRTYQAKIPYHGEFFDTVFDIKMCQKGGQLFILIVIIKDIICGDL